MPTYEYECPIHGVFEVFQRITDAPLPACLKLRANKAGQRKPCGLLVKRLISGGCGVIADAEKLYDTLPPRFPGDIREAKSDLPRNRAKLIGIPREERKKYERLYY